MCIESCGKPGWFDALILWFILMLYFCIVLSALGPTYSIYQTPNVYFTVSWSQKIKSCRLQPYWSLVRTDLVQQEKKHLNTDNDNFSEKDIVVGKMLPHLTLKGLFKSIV